MLPNHPSPACTFAQWHSVGGSQEPGLVYAAIFLCDNPKNTICIPIEGSQPLPKCERCGMQTPVEDLNGGHHRTELCQQGWERKRQHAAAMCSQEALRHSFMAYRGELERVEVFKYLGRLIAYDNADTQAMRLNLRKAWGCWAWILRVLRAENANARTCGMFYMATVQAVLLA
jgi:hypothetical protein